MIGGYWLKALAMASSLDGGSVAVARQEVPLPLSDFWKALAEAGEDIAQRDPGKLLRAEADLFQQGILLTEVQVLRINDTVLVSMPGEAFVEGQLTIKKHSRFSNTVVVGLANDRLGYLPTRAAFSEGGYEVVDRMMPLYVTEGALGTLCVTALDLVDRLWREYASGRPPDGRRQTDSQPAV
jgi:hypothetical protein